MKPRLIRQITVDGKPILYEINRRGCSGPWTAGDEEAMQAIVEAAVRMPRASLPGHLTEPDA